MGLCCLVTTYYCMLTMHHVCRLRCAFITLLDWWVEELLWSCLGSIVTLIGPLTLF